MDQPRDQRVHVGLEPVQTRLCAHSRKAGRVDRAGVFLIGAQNGGFLFGAGGGASGGSIWKKSETLRFTRFTRAFWAMRVFFVRINSMHVIVVMVMPVIMVVMMVVFFCGL